jgi:hypothetical protein
MRHSKPGETPMPNRLTLPAVLLALAFAGSVGAAAEPVATAPIPPAQKAEPQKPLFVAPTVEKPPKPAPKPAARHARKRHKHATAAAKPKRPVRHATPKPKPKPSERHRYYAGAEPRWEAPRYPALPPDPAPPMPPPGWYDHGYPPPVYDYPPPRRMGPW